MGTGRRTAGWTATAWTSWKGTPRRTTLLAALALGLAPTAVHGEAARLDVRVYGATSGSGLDGERALATAAAVLGSAGVETHWVGCGRPLAEDDHDPCAVRLGASELAVRLVRIAVPEDYAGQLPLGYSLVDADRGSGTLATIFVDRVEWLARAAEADVDTVLGYALAHEIGHLLLGTGEHASAGVMLAVWTTDALRGSAHDWRFTRPYADRMRAAVRARTPVR